MPRRRRRVSPEDAARAAARLVAVVHPGPRGGWVPPPSPDDPGEPAALVDPGRRGVVALVVVAVLAALVAGVVVLRGRPVEVAAPALDRSGVPMGESPAPTGEVVVSVAGKVRRPGLVRLPAGSRVDDAVRAAGGPTAGLGLLNLARRLVDGEQVLVGIAGAAPVAGVAGSSLLDLNTATADALDGLPGIGPVLAERIVEWRTEHGRFASVDQLREVPGIGESKYSQLKSKVTV